MKLLKTKLGVVVNVNMITKIAADKDKVVVFLLDGSKHEIDTDYNTLITTLGGLE